MSMSPQPAPSEPGDDPRRRELRAVRRRGLSVGIATGLYGISFGALSTASGLSLAQTMMLSAVMFTGGSQFAFIGVIGAGGSGLGAALTALLLGLRNTVYGVVLARLVPRRGLRALAAAQLTIDESAATAASGTTPEAQRAGFWAAGIAVYVLWSLFTVAGALLGAWVADPGQWGLDAAAAAAFLGLLWPRLRQGEAVAVAVAAAFVALVTSPLLPAGLPVLAAALVAVVAALRGRTDEGSGVPATPSTADPSTGNAETSEGARA